MGKRAAGSKHHAPHVPVGLVRHLISGVTLGFGRRTATGGLGTVNHRSNPMHGVAA